MADKIQVIITLRKEVADIPEGKALIQTVKTKLADNPNVTVNGHITNHVDPES